MNLDTSILFPHVLVFQEKVLLCHERDKPMVVLNCISINSTTEGYSLAGKKHKETKQCPRFLR